MRVWKHQTFLLWVIVVTACVAQLVKAGEYSPFAGLTAIPQDDKLSGQNKQQKNQKQDNNIDQRRKKKVQPKRKTPRPPPAPISSQEIDSPSSYNLDNNIYSVLIDQGETVSPPIPRRKDSGVSIQDTLLKLPNKKYSGLQIITDDIIIRNSPNQNNIHNGATQENSPISVNSADDFQELMSSADDAYDHSPIRRFSVNSETSLPPASLSTLNDFIYRLDTVYFFESLAAGTSSKPGFESFDKSLWEQYLSLSKNPVLFRQIPIHTSLNHLIFCLASVTVTTKQWLVDISEKRIIHIFNDLAASTVSVDSIQWNSLIFLFQVAGHLTSLSRLQQHLEPLSPLLLDKTFYLALISPSFKWKSKYSTQKRSPEITDWAVRQIVNLFNQPRPLGDHDLGVIQYGLYNEGRFQESLDYFSLISYPQLKNFRAALDCMGKLGHPKITLYTTQLDTKQACYDTFDQAVRRFGVGSVDSRTWNFLIRCVIKFGDVAEGRRVLDDMTVQSSSPTSSAQPSAFIYMELVLALFKDNQESAGRQFLELAIQEAILGGKDSQGRVFQMYVQFLIDDAHRPDQAWTFFKKWTDVMHLYIPRSGVEKLLQGLRQDQDRLKKNKWAREISQLTLLLQTLNKRV